MCVYDDKRDDKRDDIREMIREMIREIIRDYKIKFGMVRGIGVSIKGIGESIKEGEMITVRIRERMEERKDHRGIIGGSSGDQQGINGVIGKGGFYKVLNILPEYKQLRANNQLMSRDTYIYIAAC